MSLEPDRWYAITDVFQSAPQLLWDGSQLFRQQNVLGDADIQAELGSTGSLQITLNHLDIHDLNVMPDPLTLSYRLLRENLLCLPEVSFGYELQLRSDSCELSAGGIVCAALNLTSPIASNESRKAEVQTAYERGLLSEYYKGRADFRIASRSLKDKFNALLEAGYLPSQEWQLQAVFAQWLDTHASLYPPLPFQHRQFDDWEIRLTPRVQTTGFRISSLFTTGLPD